MSEALAAVLSKIDQNAAAKEKERAAALRTYREHVAQIAAEEALAAKQEAALLAAMKFLEVTPADLSADVATVTQVAALDIELAKTTEEALIAGQIEAKRKFEEGEEEVKRLRAAWYSANGPIAAYGECRRRRRELVTQSPRLFAAN